MPVVQPMFVQDCSRAVRPRTSIARCTSRGHSNFVTWRRYSPSQPSPSSRAPFRCYSSASGSSGNKVNHYDVLGVPETASSDDIKAAFRRRAKEWHPDVSPEADAEARFKECSLAYEVLVDSDARRAYDQQLLQSRQSSMGNFFQDIDFEDDEYIDLDEWRRERQESYRQPDQDDAGIPNEPAFDEVLRDPSQFLDRLNSEQLPSCEEPPNKLIQQLEQVLAQYGEDANFREFVAMYRHDPRELQYLRDGFYSDDDEEEEDVPETSPGRVTEEEEEVQDAELGAWLQSFGVQQDAASFVQEMGVMCGAMQIASCALCFYCAESIADCDAGEALRVTCGLGLGYLTRVSVQVENLLYPFYNDIVNFIAPSSRVPFISGVSKQSVQQTLDSTGYLLFLLLFIPQAFFHMDNEAAAQLIGFWTLGWVLADLFNIIALFIKVHRAN